MNTFLKRLAARIEAAGGRALLVGGAVVDSLLGKGPKDLDVEVYGLPYDRITEVCEDLGPKVVGRAFGIVKLDSRLCDGLDIDLNVPRRDNKIGVGHKGFNCELDPTMTPKEAATRRDFTINSLAMDIGTGEVIDPFGGVADLEAGILRATHPERFVEDPLRALRAMQLLARKAKTVDLETMELIRGMSGSFPELASERVHEEWRKLLLKADKPSVGLEFLRESGWLAHFPELEALIGCGQHPEWHPEGDVWVHTLRVVDAAAQVRDRIPDGWEEAFMFGALLHDVGKPATTVTPEMVKSGEADGKKPWSAHGHDTAGEGPAEAFMRRITRNKDLIHKVVPLVGNHMQPFGLFTNSAGKGAYRKLHNKIRLDVVGLLSWCDKTGSTGIPEGEEHGPSAACFREFAELPADKIEPLLHGRDLREAGHQPGKHFGPALKAAYEAQVADPNLQKEDLLAIAVAKL